jgi:hypothetical protein
MWQLSQELVGETRDCGALALISKFFGIVLNVATEGKMGRVRSSGSGDLLVFELHLAIILFSNTFWRRQFPSTYQEIRAEGESESFHLPLSQPGTMPSLCRLQAAARAASFP